MKIFYFTGTGNSLAVAKAIDNAISAGKESAELISIPQVMESNGLHYKDDIIGIVFPAYSLGLPNPVVKFLRKVKLKADYLFGIATKGGWAGAVLTQLKRRGKRYGFAFNYLNDIVMVDNSIPLCNLEKEMIDIKKKNTEEKLALIIEDIKNRKQYIKKPSLFARCGTLILGRLLSHERLCRIFSCNRYYADSECNKCRVCVKLCPANNISVTDSVKFGKKCVACTSCVHNCPRNAIRIKRERSKLRWRHPDVTVDELVKANSRVKSEQKIEQTEE